ALLEPERLVERDRPIDVRDPVTRVDELHTRRAYRLQIFPQQSVEHAVDPVAVPPVRPPPNALADEADPLRVAPRPLVEAVDLQVPPVVVEVEEEVPVEHPRRLVGQTLSPELRVHCEPIQMRDPAA